MGGFAGPKAGRLTCLMLGMALAVLGLGTAIADPMVVATTDGPVQATARGEMISYFAIPYAAPPVGDLRWRAPAAPAKWTATLNKSASSGSCIQTGNAAFRSGVESEDCLYLDVHAPAAKGVYPVMVWIHGGAFTSGSTKT